MLTLHDTLRIDCLNNIGYQYILADKKDSAVWYASLALQNAKSNHYVHGIAVAYSRQSQIAKHFDDDFVKSEELGRESLSWFEKTPNKEGLYTLYVYLWYTVFSQSRFDEAMVYSQKQLALAKQTGNESDMADAIGSIYAVYRQSGNYEKGFQAAQKERDFALKTKNKIWISTSLYCFAQLYELIEDYRAALRYFRNVLETDDEETKKHRLDGDEDIWFKMEFTEAFSHLHQFDSAWHYYNLFKPENDKPQNMRVWWISSGECYLEQKDYVHALQNFKLGLAEHLRLNDRNEIMRSLLDVGKAYVGLGNNAEALRYGREGLNIALQTKAKQFIRDGYQILSTVFDKLHQADSANFYFRQYIIMKDEVLNDQAKGRFAAYNYEQKIAAINEEKRLQQATLQKEALFRKALFTGLFLLTLLSGVIIRNVTLRRKHEKQKLQHEQQLQKLGWEQQASELEMQALRAQMNPHFIFNSLNSINHFILQNKKSEASSYLTKFSRLVRMILQNSQSPLIPLESEIEALKLYLELEALRFDHHFIYNVWVDENLDQTNIKVPPLLIQPYVENAIWHGLMHKPEKGHLNIEITDEATTLLCRITDDGVGREKAAALKNKSAPLYKSMGLRITVARISMLNRGSEPKDAVIINDLTLPDSSAGGTEVVLKIPLRYD
ncbi:hypothetical protein GCM10023229_09470 [Flavisolibacter ginsenosidimutans]